MANPTDLTAVPELDLTGRLIGDYQILRRLGRGAMADVYLAEQKSLKRSVAIKVLKTDLAKEDTYVRRFHHEAQAAASLVHANIVQIFEVGRIDETHFIAQEYVSGQNLRQLMQRTGTLNVAKCVSVMRQVAAALNRAGSQGIIHRDIKPENIMLTPVGEVKVADFGLARVVTDEGVDITQVGITLGTPLYMSPEQVEGRPVSPSSDIYSLGITAYQMLSGRTPFEGETALSVAVQHVKNEPTALSEMRTDLPQEICTIIHQMLTKEASERQSATDLIHQLRSVPCEDDADWSDSSLWDDPEILSPESTRVEATQHLQTLLDKKSPPVHEMNSWTWFAFAAAILVAALGGLMAWFGRDNDLLNVDPDQKTVISKEANVGKQFLEALRDGSEEAFLALEEYYPPDQNALNERYVWLSRQHRASIYLDRGQLTRAYDLFQRLSSRGEGEAELRAFGLAGEATVLWRRNDQKSSRAKLLDLLPLYQKFERNLRREIRQRLDPEVASTFETLERQSRRPELDTN